jgi:predicted nucleotidyltransferase
MPSDLLLGPPARRAILARTFLDPAQELHLRELVRLSGLAPRSIQVEVDKLVRHGLLLERRNSNRRYLRANERHPLFAPVREIVLKTIGLGDVLRVALGKSNIDAAVVFGSIAAGTAGAGSDIDLLVVGSVTLREVVRRLAKAQETMGREITPVVWSAAELERRRAGRDPFLARLMRGSLVPIIGEL